MIKEELFCFFSGELNSQILTIKRLKISKDVTWGFEEIFVFKKVLSPTFQPMNIIT